MLSRLQMESNTNTGWPQLVVEREKPRRLIADRSIIVDFGVPDPSKMLSIAGQVQSGGDTTAAPATLSRPGFPFQIPVSPVHSLMPTSTIRIATRSSQLALWQAEHVTSLLKSAHESLTVEIIHIRTEGRPESAGPSQAIRWNRCVYSGSSASRPRQRLRHRCPQPERSAYGIRRRPDSGCDSWSSSPVRRTDSSGINRRNHFLYQSAEA